MTITDINKILSRLAEQPTRENVLDFSFVLLQWMNIEPNAGNKPQLLSPQTQKLKDFLAAAPQTVQPQLYRISADSQNIRVRFAVLKKLKKEYISQLVDNDPGLSSYQTFVKGLMPQSNGTSFIPAQPYFIHFVTTPEYDKLVLIFNQGDQKRIVSFRNRLTNTQYNKIIQLWQGIGTKSKPEIADLFWKSLDIKEVNKEFYKQIKERFDALLGIVKTQHSTATENQVKQFTVRLLGRYIFCWFLKEKGIIPYSLISKDTIANTDNYYQNALLKLFFETLNTKVQDRNPLTLNKLFEKIPYLNGGLFDESEEDKLFTELKLDAWLLPFVEILESYDFTVDESSSQYQQVAVDPEMLGRIFENLLASQNEETEKLANQRKAFGAFYTPREIVDYMVNESIKAYLQTQWEQHLTEERTKHLNNPEPVGDIFGNKQPQQLAIATKRYELKQEEKEKIEKALAPLFLSQPHTDGLRKDDRNLLLSLLEKIKILDPACGSGAFPMGILHRLVELNEVLGTVKSSYELKKDILSQNIFGVDIMPMAIEIARLRAWLSLVLEEDYKPNDPKHNFGMKPLPNLDFKFVCSNSLIDLGLDAFMQESKGTLHEGFTQELVKQLKSLETLRKQFFAPALVSTEKEKLKIEYLQKRNEVVVAIEDDNEPVLKQIANKIKYWNPFDDSNPSIFFSPTWMFGVDEGFDVLIGNPPYIGQKNNNEKFREIKNTPLGRKFHQRRMDYFYFFIHKGLDFLNANGTLCLITTNYYFTATYADKLRSDIKKRSSILRIINFNELKLFESALGQHNSVILLRKPYNKEVIAKTTAVSKGNNLDVDILREVLKETYPDAIYSKKNNVQIYDSQNSNIQIDFTKNSNSEILEEILNNCEPLSTHFDLVEGIHTGADSLSNSHKTKYNVPLPKGTGIFVLTDKEVEVLNLNNEESEMIKPWYKNSDIHKWIVEAYTGKNLIYYTTKVKHQNVANIKRHLSKFKPILINRKVRSGTGLISEKDYDDFVNDKKYISYVMNASAFKKGDYHFISYPREASVFEGEKIVCPQRSKQNTFAYSNRSFYGSADIYFIKEKTHALKLKYLLGLLNSKLFYYWLYNKGKRKGEMLELYIRPLSELPIKTASEKNQKIIIDKVEKILSAKSKDINTNQLEKEMDALVYKLYELTYDGVKIIDKNFWLSEEEYEKIKFE